MDHLDDLVDSAYADLEGTACENLDDDDLALANMGDDDLDAALA